MKALRFDTTGALDALALVDADVPEPAEDEALVRVRAAGLNPSDLKNVLGRFPYTTVPRIPGRDFAGVVEAGPGKWQGRAVWGSGKGIGFVRDGSHAEYLCVPVAALAEKPECLSFAQAAACGVPWITALEAVRRADIQTGSRVVVIGAAGAVGLAATQLALGCNAQVIATVRREAQRDVLPGNAIPLLPANEQDFTQQVQATFEEGADVVIDTTGFWLAPAVKTLANHGRLVVISAPPEGTTDLPVLDFYRRGGTLIGVNSLLHDSSACARMLTSLGARFESGELPPPETPREWPLTDGIAAYQALEAGGAGKMVLTN